MNPMNGSDIVMLAQVLISPGEMLAIAVFLVVPCLAGVVGLVLSWRRRKLRALLMVAMGCGLAPAVTAIMATMGWWDKEDVRQFWKFVFMEWMPKDSGEAMILFLVRVPFILGIITLCRVYYVERKEKNQPPKARSDESENF